MATVPKADDSDLPEGFKCPLSFEVMVDPVVDPEGNSYERSHIEAWLAKSETSPITRSKLTVAQLAPNRALREAIEAHYQKMGLKVPEIPPKPKVAPAASEATSGVQLTAVARPLGDDQGYDVLVSVRTPATTPRSHCDICCVIDISGSMGTEAKLKTAKGVESHGLSLLDVVRHAVRTIIEALNDNDRLALVVFSTTARVVFPLTEMTSDAKKQALAHVDSLTPDDTTNLWDGLFQGLELLRKQSPPDRLSSVFLLTDGLPNISPPRGELAMLQRYKDQNRHLSCIINTFGFGYDINSKLLDNLSQLGGGSYAFIPDSSFVGTVFVHALSNLLVTISRDVSLALEPLNGAKILDQGVYGRHEVQMTSWGASAQLCSLQTGQDKNLVVRMSIPNTSMPYLSAVLKTGGLETASLETASFGDDKQVLVQRFRLEFTATVAAVIELMSASTENSAKATERIAELLGRILASGVADEPAVKALAEDLSGQVSEAVSRADYFTKWGRHYLPSLMRSHLLQQCNNFKDPGVQHYGGALFQTIRDSVDELFVKLPPPKPGFRRVPPAKPHSSNSSSLSSRVSTAAPPIFNMNNYHCSSAPCFAGNGRVRLADGSEKLVSQLAKGDRVAAPGGRSALVVCVLKTLIPGDSTDLVELDTGLVLTPYHPVRVGGRWVFPCELAPVVTRACDAVYSFLLDSEHIMLINGTECVSLGHDLAEQTVAHPYFGSQRVVQDLMRCSAWSSGLIKFSTPPMIRDLQTGLINGILVQ